MIERNSLSQIVVARIDLKVSRTRRGWSYRYSRQHIRASWSMGELERKDGSSMR